MLEVIPLSSLAVFIVSTAIHLYASLKQNQKLRNYTKPFILLALMALYYFAASEVLAVIMLALFFSWLGDVLLIPKGVKWFTVGGIAFEISHIFFILGYCHYISLEKVSLPIIIGLELVFLVIVSYIFSKLKPHLPKKLFYPMFFYLLVNGTMNCFAILRMISDPNPDTITTCIGAILFFISDSSLFFVRFDKTSKLKTHFIVMLTYSIGELLIILGLL